MSEPISFLIFLVLPRRVSRARLALYCSQNQHKRAVLLDVKVGISWLGRNQKPSTQMRASLIWRLWMNGMQCYRLCVDGLVPSQEQSPDDPVWSNFLFKQAKTIVGIAVPYSATNGKGISGLPSTMATVSIIFHVCAVSAVISLRIYLTLIINC